MRGGAAMRGGAETRGTAAGEGARGSGPAEWDAGAGGRRVYGCAAAWASVNEPLRANATNTRANMKDPIDIDSSVLPKMEATAPSDAEIAYLLAGFVTNVRSLSVDPVIVRANWIDALDHVTARGARMLNGYAREENPFTKIGRRSVRVVVTKVVRVARDAFQILWEERILETGVPVRLERFMSVLSIVFKAQSGAEAISKNPLGVYVDGFTWRHSPIVSAIR